MGANRRFFPLMDTQRPLVFKIDTRLIVSGATNGSENPNTFRVPVRKIVTNKGIVQVSDGRPDIIVNSDTENIILTFSVPGIYTIKLFGNLWFTFTEATTSASIGYDRLKIIELDYIGTLTGIQTRAFNGCLNLDVNIKDSLVLPINAQYVFRGVKSINFDLGSVITSKCNVADGIVQNVISPLSTLLNPFWLNITSFTLVYTNVDFTSNITKIEIISDSITYLNQPMNAMTTPNPTLEFICRTPNLQRLYRTFHSGQIRTKCHAGNIDVRNVTFIDQWLTGTFQTWQVDATLLGWAQLPFMQAGVTWDWNGSKYSNSPAVIAALNKITNDWGVIFTNLTMA